MKKTYLINLLVLLCAFSFTQAQVIFEEDFESYPLGDVLDQNTEVWGVWSGDHSNAAESIDVSDAFAASGTQSGFLGAGPGPQDAILLLGNRTEGTFDLAWRMYIPAGRTAYFNIQGMTSETGGAGNGANGVGVFNSPNLVFNNTGSANGTAGLGGAYPVIEDLDPIYSWSYPEDQWFDLNLRFLLDTGSWILTVDGQELEPQPMAEDLVMGGIDFFPIDANNEFYIDDIVLSEFVEDPVFPAGINDNFSASLAAFPNPVVDFLQLETELAVERVEVFNALGQKLLVETPRITSPRIDLTQLGNGIHFLRVTIEGESKTLPIRK